jgi:riboflavin kinase/FMN adenylyltransferase
MKNKQTAVTIGTFDGVHKGHAALIKKLKSVNLKTVAVVLETPFKNVSGLLTETSEKLNLLALSGVNEIFVIPENSEVFDMTAEKFLNEILIKRIKAKHIVVGHDFVFGKNKTGTYKWLCAAARRVGVNVHLVRAVKVNNETVSSSAIRKALEKGNIKKAAQMLGRDYAFFGVSVKGRGMGRKIGFPTINIKVSKNKILPLGVFAVALKMNGIIYPAVLNIGNRPTYNLGAEIVPEAHVLGERVKVKRGTGIEVELLKKIRAEKKFSLERALINAIKKDVAAATGYFNLKQL